MTGTYHHEKHFNVAEAIETLHLYYTVMQKMQRLARYLKTTGYDIHRHKYFGGMGPDGDREHPAELEQLVDILKKLDSAGIQVKGIESGIIDFPHIRENGEEVYLCFKLGEPTIQFWHHIDAGFAGRQPLDAL